MAHRLIILILGVFGLRCLQSEGLVNGSCYPQACVTETPSGEPALCNGLGTCMQRSDALAIEGTQWHCVCDKGAIPVDGHCVSMSCLADTSSSVVCSGGGVCINGQCACYNGHIGRLCEENHVVCRWSEEYINERCVPLECVYDGIECNGRGVCQRLFGDSYRCHCDSGMQYLPDYGCTPLACIGDTPVPCENGLCSEVLAGKYTCQCPPGMLFAGMCAPVACVEMVEKGVCSRVGVCTDSCRCPQLHTGAYCERCMNDAKMIGGVCVSRLCIDADGLVCSGKGVCVQRSGTFHCACNEDYFPVNSLTCVPRSCVAEATNDICSSHGSCVDRRCACTEGWQGALCDTIAPMCPRTEAFAEGSCYPLSCVINSLVCNGHGTCRDGTCRCYTYASPHSELLCYPSNCLLRVGTDTVAACPNGDCVYIGSMLGYQCDCHNGYSHVNRNCVLSVCVDYLRTPQRLCSNTGMCDLTAGCVCPRSTTGRQCSFTPHTQEVDSINNSTSCVGTHTSWILIDRQSVPDACVTGPNEVCFNRRGYCVNTHEYGWGCRCYSHYTGPTCSVCSSRGRVIDGTCLPVTCASPLSSGGYVACGGHGECSISFTPNDSGFDGRENISCDCDDTSLAINSTCVSLSCIDLANSSTDNTLQVCSTHGTCEVDTCLCFEPYGGQYCSYRVDVVCEAGYEPVEGKCVPQDCIYQGTVCGNHGSCTPFKSDQFSCACNEGFTLSVIYGCQPSVCVADDGLLCKGGKCVLTSSSNYECICQEGYKVSHGECHPQECVDLQGNICNVNLGRCIFDIYFKSFRCECLDGYWGVFCGECAQNAITVDNICIPPQCYMKDGDDTYICGGLGSCVHQYGKKSYCVCVEGAITQMNGQCASRQCVEPGAGAVVCSNAGDCINGHCICTDVFYGVYCEKIQPLCEPGTVFVKEEEACISTACMSNKTVCGGHGKCIGSGYNNSQLFAFCACNPGYALYNKTCINPRCIIDSTICLNGRCTNSLEAEQPCVCNSNFTWTGSACTYNDCINGKDMYGKHIICSGKGHCNGHHGCVCHSIYEGKLCEGCGRQGILLNNTCFPAQCVGMRDGTYNICDNYGACERQTLGIGLDTYSCMCRTPNVDIGDGRCYSSLCVPDPVTKIICNGNGYCKGGHCICLKGHKGRRCEYKS